MRVVIQRCKSASVKVDGKNISEIKRGLLLLVGLGAKDGEAEMDYCIKKILSTKFFPSSESNAWGWSSSVMESNFEILSISQFTLYANIKKGSKPDFHAALAGEPAEKMYSEFLEKLRSLYVPTLVLDGVFGAMMDVSLVNDGPCTIIVDSDDGPKPQPEGDSSIKDEKNRIKKEARLARMQLEKEKLSLENVIEKATSS